MEAEKGMEAPAPLYLPWNDSYWSRLSLASRRRPTSKRRWKTLRRLGIFPYYLLPNGYQWEANPRCLLRCLRPCRGLHQPPLQGQLRSQCPKQLPVSQRPCRPTTSSPTSQRGRPGGGHSPGTLGRGCGLLQWRHLDLSQPDSSHRRSHLWHRTLLQSTEKEHLTWHAAMNFPKTSYSSLVQNSNRRMIFLFNFANILAYFIIKWVYVYAELYNIVTLFYCTYVFTYNCKPPNAIRVQDILLSVSQSLVTNCILCQNKPYEGIRSGLGKMSWSG